MMHIVKNGKQKRPSLETLAAQMSVNGHTEPITGEQLNEALNGLGTIFDNVVGVQIKSDNPGTRTLYRCIIGSKNNGTADSRSDIQKALDTFDETKKKLEISRLACETDNPGPDPDVLDNTDRIILIDEAICDILEVIELINPGTGPDTPYTIVNARKYITAARLLMYSVVLKDS